QQHVPAAAAPPAENACAHPTIANTAVFLSGALTGGKDSSNTTATSGALGISRLSSTWSFSSQINIDAKQDTCDDGFGASLLTPGAGKSLTAGLFEWRRSIQSFFG